MLKILDFSILIPTYNGEDTIVETIVSILKNSKPTINYEIIISDDNSSDSTIKLIENFKDSRIKIFRHEDNLGYPKNINRGSRYAVGKYLFLMGQDDILAEDVLIHYKELLDSDESIGAITRPYYAFDSDKRKPIRYKKLLTPNQTNPITVSIKSNPKLIHGVFSTLDQLSGLCFRKKLIKCDFHDDVFPCHVYPFAQVFREYPIIFTNRYTIAVRVNSSQCIKVSNIYDKSPVQTWIDLINFFTTLQEDKTLNKYLIRNFVCGNWIGLLQIKNYSKKPYLYFLRESLIMIKNNPKILLNPAFILVNMFCFFLPRAVSIPVVNWYKENVSSIFTPTLVFKGQDFSIGI